MGRLVIYGAGGFGREVVRIARHTASLDPSYTEVVFASDDADQVGIVAGLSVIRSTQIRPDDRCVVSVSDPGVRRIMAERCPEFATLVGSMAVTHDEVSIGAGSIICDFCSVLGDAATRIGRHCQMNIYSAVGHDCTIGDFVTIGPSVSVNGNVVIEDDAYIGCGARLRNGKNGQPLRIGRGATVGMGAIVVKDVPPGVTVVGNPAMPMPPRLQIVG